MSDKRYWLWLQMCLGAGARFKEILDDFGSVEKLYHSNFLERRISPVLTSKQADRLERFSLNDTEEIIYSCENNRWHIIPFDDERYPQRLREIPNPPAVLYADGTLPRFDDYAVIGMVGTRRASSYALKAAHIMSKGISLCGALTVSGGALGVDTAAHQGALSAGAKTYAVLGCGLGTPYLRSNNELRNAIKTNGGALLTEYPPYTQATKQTFPLRNRIISGLSNGVLIVEAGVKSGSLITASFACEQNRDIYAIPASILDDRFYGTNKLIDDGAVVATSPGVLLERYAAQYPTLDMSRLKTVRELYESDIKNNANAPEREQVQFDEIARDRARTQKRAEAALALTGDEKTVYHALNEGFESIETIIERSALESRRVLAALTLLEMKGLVQSASGKRYQLKG